MIVLKNNFFLKKNNWYSLLKKEFSKNYFIKLLSFLENEYNNYNIFPKIHDIFNAFYYTDFFSIKVVIIGQDPYHSKNLANGLAFSVNKESKIPPSLNNIFKELKNDIGKDHSYSGDLTEWSKQGVFLLNSILTVRENCPKSHINKGWEIFTDTVIKLISNKRSKIVYILWGNYAIKKNKYINKKNNFIISTSHPSPFSAKKSFFSSKPFSKTNYFLEQNNIDKIKW